jgi:hypothetical protein
MGTYIESPNASILASVSGIPAMVSNLRTIHLTGRSGNRSLGIVLPTQRAIISTNSSTVHQSGRFIDPPAIVRYTTTPQQCLYHVFHVNIVC